MLEVPSAEGSLFPCGISAVLLPSQSGVTPVLFYQGSHVSCRADAALYAHLVR